ncbi:MAG: serine/threonine protein kinase, partial [Acidimicrobiales bacterium]|nr:serine/threonine protein kinase [Acidimicrobiales bacterium]
MPVTPLEPSDPQRLGDFVLTDRLGAGGMGIVYLGRGRDDAPVAVKLVRADLAHDETFRERFRREVEALRRVSGPRVAALVDADTEAPQPYLVVEFVDGPTLADSVARDGPLEGPRLRALAAALAEALVLIHEQGVIHRDLKPSNVVMCSADPDETRAKVLDFGVAKVFWPDDQLVQEVVTR